MKILIKTSQVGSEKRLENICKLFDVIQRDFDYILHFVLRNFETVLKVITRIRQYFVNISSVDIVLELTLPPSII